MVEGLMVSVGWRLIRRRLVSLHDDLSL